MNQSFYNTYYIKNSCIYHKFDDEKPDNEIKTKNGLIKKIKKRLFGIGSLIIDKIS
jgi:hypothetical protein